MQLEIKTTQADQEDQHLKEYCKFVDTETQIATTFSLFQVPILSTLFLTPVFLRFTIFPLFYNNSQCLSTIYAKQQIYTNISSNIM